MTSPRIFVVTGSNRGIGYAIVKRLAEEVEGAIIYLTARSQEAGEKAVQDLDIQLANKRKSEIRYHYLDVDEIPSITKFADYLKAEHGGLDVLIHNAGVATHNDDPGLAKESADFTISTNYYGMKNVCSRLLPLIRPGGRICNICSQAGVMHNKNYDPRHIERLKNAQREKDIDDFVEEYRQCCADNTREQHGFVDDEYQISKAAAIAYTMLLWRLHQDQDIKINACCPGHVSTDMTLHRYPETPEEGADTPFWLATSPDAPNGKFVNERTVWEWP